MKTILLFRHAKSDWEAGADADHERPLAKRGKKAAALMGRYLAALGEVPGEAHASTAVRAAETLRLAAEAGAWTCEVRTARELYEASPETALSFIQRLDDASDAVILVGHEPTLSELLGALVGGAHVELPTAAMARLEFPAETWSGISFGTGKLAWLTTPKLLEGIGWH